MNAASAAPAPSPDRLAGRHPTLRLLGPLTPHWRRLGASIAASVVAELAAVALMATAAWLISRAAGQPPLAALAVAIVAVRALALGRGVFRYADRLLGHDAVLAAMAGLRARVYAALEPLAPSGTSAFRGGELLTRLVDDVDAAQDLLLRCLVPATVAGVVGAAVGGFSAAILPRAGAVLTTGLLAAGLLIPAGTYVASARAGRRGASARDDLAVETVDLTEGADDLAAFGAAEAVLARAERTSARLARLERRKALTTGAATAATLLVQGGTTVGVTLLALRAREAGQLPAVLLPVLALTALTAFEVMTPLPAAARRFAEVRASSRRLAAVLDAPPPVHEPSAPVPAAAPPVAVEVGDLRVRYRAAGAPALDGIDLRVEPGRRVALVGASGSGKSTLLAVLMRFVEYERGRAEIGGRDLRAYHGDDIRRLVTGVTQDAHVFHATLRENIGLARPEATRQQLEDAARRARLLGWIESLPEGWDTLVGGDGAAVSGGQRARIVLARALLADPPVLVLDEPTEGLDPETADGILADLLEATEGRTTLLVTHRLTGLAAVDEVVVLDEGRIVRRGHHDELVGESGYYRALCSAQLLAEPRWGSG